jgi:hypothetical protein
MFLELIDRLTMWAKYREGRRDKRECPASAGNGLCAGWVSITRTGGISDGSHASQFLGRAEG